MPGALQIEGAWPGPIAIRKGWFKATARPWNKVTDDATVRMERGTAAFLKDASGWLRETVPGAIYSPALYRSATRVWVRAGYEPFIDLVVMERRLADIPDRSEKVTLSADPDLNQIESLDRAAFDPFWHMGVEGLIEAIDATPVAGVLEAFVDGELGGYAIVGVQLGIAYLQRIATHPDFRGRGLGHALVVDACHWGRAAGSSNMVLNVKPDNAAAIALYAKAGFSQSGNRLHVMRYNFQS